MRIGIQTITWGPKIDDLDGTLAEISALGYKGVEFAQRPPTLGNIDDLVALLQKHGLELLGFSGGSLRDRIRFCGNAVRPPYLYVENWDQTVAPEAVRAGFRLALHPHIFKQVQTLRDAQTLLEAHPELLWLPDTAHLQIAGDDPARAVTLFRDRLIAVHLKDWTPAYGRSHYGYSRGFVEFGRGIVPIDKVLAALSASPKYEGWVVVEQDMTRVTSQDSARASAEYLAGRGFLPQPAPRRVLPPVLHPEPPPLSPAALNRELRFTRTILGALSEDITSFYDRVVMAFRELIPCELVTLWGYSSLHDNMTLLATTPRRITQGRETLETRKGDQLLRNVRESLSGIAVERQAVTGFDLSHPQPGAPYGLPELQFRRPDIFRYLSTRTMISIPILNPHTLNHVRFVLNLFPHGKPEDFQGKDEELFRFGVEVGRLANTCLDHVCSSAAAHANYLASQSQSVEDLLNRITLLIQQSVQCEGLSIFLVNSVGDRLELKATTGIRWHVAPSEQFYRKGERSTGQVWERSERMLTVDGRTEKGGSGKSTEIVQTAYDSCLFTPLVNARGKCLGVVRCHNKRPIFDKDFNMWSDDDVAIIDAIAQATVPHIEILVSEEKRGKALLRTMHELRMPLVAIQGAVQCMEVDLTSHGIVPAKRLFAEDYLGDLFSWTELMSRLIDNADFSGAQSETFKIRPKPILLMKEVIAPAVRQASILLRARNFSVNRIQYGRFEQVPHLWVDKNLFQQVVFNLLSNAIKYAFNDPQRFNVYIDGKREGDTFQIIFRDEGPGIDPSLKEVIFEEGVRGPKSLNDYVAGQGLGLWLVRRIIEAHGGKIQVTNVYMPTVITIFLPYSLSLRPLQR